MTGWALGHDDLHQHHAATAARADCCGWIGGFERLLWFNDRASFGGRDADQLAAEDDILNAMSVGEKAIVPDAVEAIRQRVHEEAAHELICGKRHHLGLAVLTIVLPTEPHIAAIHGDEAAVGDGYPVSVAGEIGEHLLGPCEGPLGIDHPVLAAQGVVQ